MAVQPACVNDYTASMCEWLYSQHVWMIMQPACVNGCTASLCEWLCSQRVWMAVQPACVNDYTASVCERWWLNRQPRFNRQSASNSEYVLRDRVRNPATSTNSKAAGSCCRSLVLSSGHWSACSCQIKAPLQHHADRISEFWHGNRSTTPVTSVHSKRSCWCERCSATNTMPSSPWWSCMCKRSSEYKCRKHQCTQHGSRACAGIVSVHEQETSMHSAW